MHTYIMYFQRVCCWFAEAFDLWVLFGVKPCADVLVSAARRPSQNIGARRRWRGGGGAAAVARRRWRKVFELRILTWGFVRGRAVRRLHCVGGCAPVNFGRRRRAAGPQKSAARRRNCNIYRRPRRGGGAAWRGWRGGPKKCSEKFCSILKIF